MMQIAKLFQSMKFSGVATLSAAVPIRPSVAGLRPAIIPLNISFDYLIIICTFEILIIVIMKKIICLLFAAFIGFIHAEAQESDSLKLKHVTVDSLSTELNELRQNFDLLYCDFELSKIQCSINSFRNNLGISSNSILINCYHSNFDIDLYISYKNNYDRSVELFNSLKNRALKVRELVALKILFSNFSEKEVDYLKHASMDLLDSSVSAAERSLDFYKVVLNMYKDLK